MPYPNLMKQYLKNPEDIPSYIAATYDYNFFIRRYQNFAAGVQNERFLPCWYVTNLLGEIPDKKFERAKLINNIGKASLNVAQANVAASAQPDQAKLHPAITDFYTRGGSTPLARFEGYLQWPPRGYQTAANDAEAPQKTTPPYYITYLDYLNGMFVAAAPLVEPASNRYVDSRFRNMLFNSNAVSRHLKEKSDAVIFKKMVPFYNKINFPTQPAGKYSLNMIENGFTTMFLRKLKETFLNQNERVPMSSVQFLRNQEFLSSHLASESNNIKCTSNVVEHRSVDLIKMLIDSYKTIRDEYEDFYIVDYNNLDTDAIYDVKSVYRSYNTRNVVKVTNDILATQSPGLTSYYVNSMDAILNSQRVTNDADKKKKILEIDDTHQKGLRPDSKYNEVIAYRIEKIGGPGTGDSNTQSAIQNFWIFNTPDLDILDFVDSQVKYDTPYTYNVYAYYIVEGFKYKNSNLRVSRIIGQVSDDVGESGPISLGTGIRGVPEEPPDAYCIEYYDPFTGQRMPDMLEDIIYDPALGESADLAISRLASDAQRVAVSSKRSEGGGVLPPYIAQFMTTCQPSIRLIEIPMLQKTYRILDNPPASVNPVPYFYNDNSNRLNFELYYQTPTADLYPRVILESDETVKAQYLHGHDFIPITTIDYTFASVSPVTAIQVYRLPYKPRNFKEFAGNLYKTISLKVPNSNYAYTTAIFDDIVKSNKKYYYLFRAVNELGIAGDVNTIIEAEMVNDGGYKYANFETLFEEDLEIPSHKETSLNFQKLFQITPRMSQVNLDSTLTSIQNTSEEEYDKVKIGTAEDLIWGKTFKIRLTSKKTGKKIDLNIKYENPSDETELLEESKSSIRGTIGVNNAIAEEMRVSKHVGFLAEDGKITLTGTKTATKKKVISGTIKKTEATFKKIDYL